ncbi:MAG: cobalt-precorrin-4 C(11)-methyltransferase, partial [Methanosarcinaceae archaeon]|nr:cobalt-precorrin-4 C(11)-methyltransferase [Methanosarcinaceae archaeon]
MSEKKNVYFVGAGPGNPKLITILGRELLESADLVVYAGSLVNPKVLDYSNGEKIDSYGLTLDEITKTMADHVKAGKKVVRLHSG